MLSRSRPGKRCVCLRHRKMRCCDVESRNAVERIGIFEKAYLYSQLEYAHAAGNTDIRSGIQVCTRQTVFKSAFCIFFFCLAPRMPVFTVGSICLEVSQIKGEKISTNIYKKYTAIERIFCYNSMCIYQILSIKAQGGCIWMRDHVYIVRLT